MKKVWFSTSVGGLTGLVLLASFAVGCQQKPGEAKNPRIAMDTTEVPRMDSETLKRLAKHSIHPAHLALQALSPDSSLVAVVLDSTVRFGPGDKMWSEELPRNCYGKFHRSMLYLYDRRADSIFQIDECDPIVNFYDKKTSTPRDGERWERYVFLRWAPHALRLLVLRDRESEGRRSQDALVFEPGLQMPVFLDIFSVWQELMLQNPGAHGTQVEGIGWVGDTGVRIVFSVKGASSALRREVIFDSETGMIVSSKDLVSS